MLMIMPQKILTF